MTNIVEFDGALCFRAGMNVDADGSPRAYGPTGGLDYLGNAGAPGKWYGVLTDNNEPGGEPVVQGLSDPCPGMYVSPTALQDRSKNLTDPRRYVDSEHVPYVSVPGDLGRGVRLGDFCWIVRGDVGAGAVVADVGPRGKYGEGSIALAERLGIPSSPKIGGCDSGVTYVIFLNSRGDPPWPVDLDILQSRALARFWAWGGADKLARVPL